MPEARREVAVKMKPTAVKRCIIEIKGHEDITVSLYTNHCDTQWRQTTRPRDQILDSLDIKTFLMMVSFILKGHFQSDFESLKFECTY